MIGTQDKSINKMPVTTMIPLRTADHYTFRRCVKVSTNLMKGNLKPKIRYMDREALSLKITRIIFSICEKCYAATHEQMSPWSGALDTERADFHYLFSLLLFQLWF